MGERFSPIQRSTLLLCFFAYAAAYTGRLNLSAAIPGLRGGIAMSDAQAGLFQTVFALVYAAGSARLCLHPRWKTHGRSIRNAPGLIDQVHFCVFFCFSQKPYFFIASAVATATATVAPTMGLLPMPRKPIISTCAGTEEEPAN